MKDASHCALDYSVVIPAYNEESYLPLTIDRLKKAMAAISEKSGELIVVDNQSTDSTSALAKRLHVRLVAEKVRGIARARNAGAQVARGKHLFFVDADTLVNEGVLRKSLEYLSSGQVGAGGAVLSSIRRKEGYFLEFYSPKCGISFLVTLSWPPEVLSFADATCSRSAMDFLRIFTRVRKFSSPERSKGFAGRRE